MLLHKTLVYVTIFLLCLSLSSTAPQDLHHDAEVQASLAGETHPPQQGIAAGAAAAEHLTVTTQEQPRESPVTGDSSRQDKRRIKPPNWGRYEKEDSLEADKILQSNTTQGVVNKRKRRADGGGMTRDSTQSNRADKESVALQAPKRLDTAAGWFTEELNVTITPRVTWSHRTAFYRSPPPTQPRRRAGLAGGPLWYLSTTRFVELVLVADHSFFVKYGDQTRSRCKAVVNIVNAMYRPLGVVVVLSHLEVWEHGDKIPVTANYGQNLQKFQEYRKKILEEEPDYNNDNTMLLTTVDFTGNTVGVAVVSGMCGITGSAGVVQDVQKHVGVTASALAHEMGHNFGMKHDKEYEDSCHCKSCIMGGMQSSTSESNSRILWSACDRQVIEKRLDSVDYWCLRNVPTRMYPSTSCGDGVVDAGEQCDCGPAEFCDNPCCVASTCRFAVNASCASGPCCDTKTCQPKSAGTVCRAAFTECDLPEFCSGDTESCPEDVTKADGAPCHGGQGHCYKAKCGSHEGQCQSVWGQSARVADLACYSKLNKEGKSNGNCGYNGQRKTDLLPCAEGDELCGSLHCLPEPNAKPQLLFASFSYGTLSFSRHSCSYIISSDSLPVSSWVTPDGARCGEGKMCIKQKCVRVPEPAGHCRDGCSGRGVCNSHTHCHCDPGFAPPDCSKEGSGGSIDSNSPRRDRYKDQLWEVFAILIFILLGVAVAICCLWGCIRRRCGPSGLAVDNQKRSPWSLGGGAVRLPALNEEIKLKSVSCPEDNGLIKQQDQEI